MTDSEEHAFENTQRGHRQINGGDGFVPIQHGRNPDRRADQHAAEDTDRVRVKREQRHHQDQCQHAGQHEEIEGIEAERSQRVDFLVGLHAAEVGGEGGSGAAAHDDGRHHHTHFTDHGDAHQIRDIKAGSEAGELDVSHKRQDQPDKETDERNNRQGLRTAFLDDDPEIAGAEAGPACYEASQRQHRLPGELGHGQNAGPYIDRNFSQLGDFRFLRGHLAGIDFLRYGQGQLHQPAKIRRQAFERRSHIFRFPSTPEYR